MNTLAILALALLPAAAEEPLRFDPTLRDPMASPVERLPKHDPGPSIVACFAPRPAPPRPAVPRFSIEGFLLINGKAHAFIDGQTLKAGDSVQGCLLESITQRDVRLRCGARRLRRRMP